MEYLDSMFTHFEAPWFTNDVDNMPDGNTGLWMMYQPYKEQVHVSVLSLLHISKISWMTMNWWPGVTDSYDIGELRI